MIASIVAPLDSRPTVTDLGASFVLDVSSLIDTLINESGVRRLHCFAPVESDMPDRAVCKRALVCIADARLRLVRSLKPPEPVDTPARLPDHPPDAFNWREVRLWFA